MDGCYSSFARQWRKGINRYIIFIDFQLDFSRQFCTRITGLSMCPSVHNSNWRFSARSRVVLCSQQWFEIRRNVWAMQRKKHGSCTRGIWFLPSGHIGNIVGRRHNGAGNTWPDYVAGHHICNIDWRRIFETRQKHILWSTHRTIVARG